MSINLYIFNESRRGGMFGIGTYIQELSLSIYHANIKITVINIFSEKESVFKETINGVEHWFFPAPVVGWNNSDINKQRSLYFQNILYFLRMYIKKEENLIFQFNYHNNQDFAEKLKETFKCKIISIVHYSEWSASIFDNLSYLKRILQNHSLQKTQETVYKEFEGERLDYEKADHIISLSFYMQKVLNQCYGFCVDKITVIPNGLRDMLDNSTSIHSLRKKWYLEEDERIILFAGRIDKIKGVSYLLRAFSIILNNYPKCRLFIAGNGIYDHFFSEISNIWSKISFTGLLSRRDLYELYRMADVGVVPSLFEPFGYVPVEMMMHELPIVATATSGLNEVVDESCGLKVPLTVSDDKVEIDTDLLAEKIIYLLQNPEEARRLGRNGRKRYLEKYSSEVFGRNMLAFYRSLFADEGAAREP